MGRRRSLFDWQSLAFSRENALPPSAVSNTQHRTKRLALAPDCARWAQGQGGAPGQSSREAGAQDAGAEAE